MIKVEEDEEIHTNESEVSSDASHRYNVPRSRQAICRPLVQKCFQNVLDHQNALAEEDFWHRSELFEPLARHYVDRVLKRLRRLLDGEYLGGMVDSEFENLEVDDEFERQRQKMEVPSSYHDVSEYLS